MFTTVLAAVGLNGPSLPSLPLLTCACAAKLSESAMAAVACVRKEKSVGFIINGIKFELFHYPEFARFWQIWAGLSTRFR